MSRRRGFVTLALMKLVGLTGGIASGKSTVSRMFSARGAAIVDADAVYHELVRAQDGKPSALARQIEARFPGVLHDNGELDRAALGARVFAAAAERQALGEITHPRVAGAVAEKMAELAARGVTLVLYDVPLLFERRLEEGMHATIVVWVPREVQLARLCARDRLTLEAAEARLKAQLPLDAKRRRATYVIDNSGSQADTETQVETVWSALAG